MDRLQSAGNDAARLQAVRDQLNLAVVEIDNISKMLQLHIKRFEDQPNQQAIIAHFQGLLAQPPTADTISARIAAIPAATLQAIQAAQVCCGGQSASP